jgi:hypothetical protein
MAVCWVESTVWMKVDLKAALKVELKAVTMVY